MFRAAFRVSSTCSRYGFSRSNSLARLSSTSSAAASSSSNNGSKAPVGEPLTKEGIESLLSKPTWSVDELLAPPPTSSSSSLSADEEITPSKLHHLLRLSALPLPASQAEEESMIATLREQLHFVRRVQQVDTTGVEPLVAIRNERAEARKEREITLDTVKEVLANEEQVGYYKRIIQKGKRGTSAAGPEKEELMERERQRQSDLDWDPLERAPEKMGRFIKVNIEQR